MHLPGTLSETNSLPYVWTLLIHLFPRYYDFNAVFDRAKDRRGSDPAVIFRESFVSITGITFAGVLCFGCLAPSPSRSSRLHLAETRWFIVLPHRPYWLLVYLPSPCVFLFYCFMSFLSSRCRFSRFLHPWIVSSWPWQMETECFHSQGSCIFSNFQRLLAKIEVGQVLFFHLFSIDGTQARNISKVLRFAIVVVPIMNVLSRALSFLPLLVICRVESMRGLYLLCRYMSRFLLNLRLSIQLRLRESRFAPAASGLRRVKPLLISS